MKLLLPFLLMIPIVSLSQFHVRVEPNPANNGEVNPAWMNNYIITFTLDEWTTSAPIKSQLTYYSHDDNGRVYYISYYDILTFQNKEDAIRLAKDLKSAIIVSRYLRNNLLEHQRLREKFEYEKRKLCFGCKKRENKKETPIQIY